MWLVVVAVESHYEWKRSDGEDESPSGYSEVYPGITFECIKRDNVDVCPNLSLNV